MKKEFNKTKFKDFPEKLKKRVLEIREQQYRVNHLVKRNIENHSLVCLFRFGLTEEGHDYWNVVYQSNNFNDFLDEKIKDRYLSINIVQSVDGSIFKIGDTVKVFNKSSPNYGKTFTIKRFRWNKEKTNICAVTSTHTFGIRLDWIEHYVEKKPDFILPKKWFIQRNFTNYKIINEYFLKTVKSLNSPYLTYGPIGLTELKNDYVSSYSNSYFIRNNYEEITFEQFKQYVLFDGFKIGDCFHKQKPLSGEIIKVNKKQIIDLQYINGQSVAFYKYVDTNYSDSFCRILIKNIIK